MIVAVYGASGHTGRFVVAELLRRGHTPIAIGRDAATLATATAAHDAVEQRIATLDSARLLDRALLGADAVINCAGPFLDTAQPVIESALRCGAHYFDVTAEQACAQSTFDVYDAPARDRGIVVVPAAGFYGGLGDLLATAAMGDWPDADRIDIAIALDRWWPTSGTRRTGERNTAPRQVISNGRLVEVSPSAPAPWRFPEPFGTQPIVEVPLSETILIARHLHVRELHNYINEAPLRDLSDPQTAGPVATDERNRSDQQFVVEVRVSRGADERRAGARGRDIYAITAPIVVEAVERSCAIPLAGGGTFALAQLVDSREFLASFGRRGDLEPDVRR
jgi:NAD(P)-dependent dehydrogenase (short-subunit alcohol dehydrogenase family)